MIAQSYEEFFHDHTDKQLDVLLTNNSDVVSETKLDTKLLNAYSHSDHQAFSTTLHVSPEKPFAVQQLKLALKKANWDEFNESMKKFPFNPLCYYNVIFVEQL